VERWTRRKCPVDGAGWAGRDYKMAWESILLVCKQAYGITSRDTARTEIPLQLFCYGIRRMLL
jgi:hypothetical protein